MIRRVNEIGFDPNLTDADHPYGRNNNLGKTQRVGIENFLECKPLAWMKWRVSHAYTEAIFKSNTTSFSENEISGDSLPMVPLNRWTSSVLVQPLKNMELYLDMVYFQASSYQ
jgi:hypothetical protein